MTGHFKIKSMSFPGVSSFPPPTMELGSSHKRKPFHEDLSFGPDKMEE